MEKGLHFSQEIKMIYIVTAGTNVLLATHDEQKARAAAHAVLATGAYGHVQIGTAVPDGIILYEMISDEVYAH